MVEAIQSGPELALSRAILYRAAAHALRHPDREWLAEWRALAAGAREASAACREEDSSPAALGEEVEAAFACRLEQADLVREHARVIGHIPRMAATPYETEWTGAAGDLLQYHQMSDVAAFYKAFGLELGRQCGERPDHASIELEFMHFLCVKEAWAQDQGLADLAELCRASERKFLAEHLARWIPGLCARMAALSQGGFYARTAELLRLWIEDECRRLDVEPAEPLLAPSATSFTLEDACIRCGHAAACRPERGEEAGDGA